MGTKAAWVAGSGFICTIQLMEVYDAEECVIFYSGQQEEMTGGQDESHTNRILSYVQLTVNVKLTMIALLKCSATPNIAQTAQSGRSWI